MTSRLRSEDQFSKTREQLDDRVRVEKLDEALKILTDAWPASRSTIAASVLVDDVQFLPRPVPKTASTGVDRGKI